MRFSYWGIDVSELDGPDLYGCDHVCNAIEFGRCACACHDRDDCGCDCCIADCDTCDHCEARLLEGDACYPFGVEHDRVCAACNVKVLAEPDEDEDEDEDEDIEEERRVLITCQEARRG